MLYSPEMIKVISQARRQAASEDKASIKLANPTLFFELEKLYNKSDDIELKAMITKAFELAGDGWPAKLAGEFEVTEHPSIETQYITKVYRGQTQRVEVTSKNKIEKKTKSERVYRGQVVD